MRPRLIVAAVVMALAALVAFGFASLSLERFLLAQGGTDLTSLRHGESRIGFDFDSLRDLISEGAVGAERVRIDDGVLRANLPTGVANLRLNFRGWQLDAARFEQLQSRIQVSRATALVLIFDEPGKLEENIARVELVPGWNTLVLRLDELPWKPARAAADATTATEAWGGRSHRVAEFRLYFEGPPDLAIGLDRVHFTQALDPSIDPVAGIEWIDAAQARARLARADRPLTAVGRTLGVRLPVWTQTPEALLSLRDALRARDAEILFWPAYRPLPSDSAALPARAPHGWSPPLGWVGLFGALLLLARLRLNVWTRQGALIDLALGLGPIMVLSAGLGLDERPSPGALGILLLALTYMFSRVDLRQLGGVGSAFAWRESLFATTALAVGLLAIALGAGHLEFPGLQRAGLYLPFVALQQALLLGFLLPRAQRLAPRSAPLLAGILFAAAHAPNFALMVGCAAAGALWCVLFRRGHAALPVIASHYALGLCAVSLLPPWLLYSAEVSLRFFLLR